NGGIARSADVCELPIRLIESGPAGGALLTTVVGSQLGLRDLLAFDMGGTTAKVCLIEGGRPKRVDEIEVDRMHRFKPGSGIVLRAPVVDMLEIGAGGGSIAEVDQLHRLRVGPRSAGASPGPVCYGLGGTEATVTDACVDLGY